LKFQAVGEKIAKDAKGLLYFAAPSSGQTDRSNSQCRYRLVGKAPMFSSQHVS